MSAAIDTGPRERPVHEPPAPRCELDLAVALAAYQQTSRLLPDRDGGAVLNLAHPLAHLLVPHAPTLGAWVLTTNPGDVEDLRACSRPAVTVVVHATSGEAASQARHHDADLLVVGDLTPECAGRGVLLDIDAVHPWRGLPDRDRFDVRGFAVTLPTSRCDLDTTIARVRSVCASWELSRRGRRPLLLVHASTAHSVAALVTALRRASMSHRAPMPVLRVDLTAAVLDSATTTRVSVRACATEDGDRVIVLDHLPARHRGLAVAGPGVRIEVVLRDAFARSTRTVSGGLLEPGTVLLAPGWDPELPLDVRLLDPPPRGTR